MKHTSSKINKTTKTTYQWNLNIHNLKNKFLIFKNPSFFDLHYLINKRVRIFFSIKSKKI